MKLSEIILDKKDDDSDLPAAVAREMELLQGDIKACIDLLSKQSVFGQDRLIVKNKLDTAVKKLGDINKITEAVRHIPHDNDGYEKIRVLFKNEIPAGIAHIFLTDVLEDDGLFDQLRHMRPEKDSRDVIALWIKDFMPEKVPLILDDSPKFKNKLGSWSIFQGEDPPCVSIDDGEITGDATGRF